jgi:hypothetical protein
MSAAARKSERYYGAQILMALFLAGAGTAFVRFWQSNANGPGHRQDLSSRARETAGLAEDFSKNPEFLNAEWAETRLFQFLPETGGLANELKQLKLRTREWLDQPLPLDYTMTPHHSPRPLGPVFEYYGTLGLLPPQGEVFHAVNANGSVCIEFAWTSMPVKKVHYVLEIAKSRRFRYFRSFGVHSQHVALEAKKASDYFWRVRAVSGSKASVSPVSRFTVLVPEDNSPAAQRRKIASRIQMEEAWLADVQVCP